LNQLVDFHDIQLEGHAIEDGSDAIILNLVTLTVPK
jgi:hypothetical protein